MRVTLDPKVRRTLIFGAAIGWLSFGAALVASPVCAWTSFLTASFYFLTLSLGTLVLLALGSVGGAGWSAVLTRVAESLGAWLPIGAVTTLATLLGVPWLYRWASDPHSVSGKRVYLNVPFFAVRMVVILGAWLIFQALLRNATTRQEQAGALRHVRRRSALSAAFLVVFGLTFSLASFDWLMSLESHFASTMFGLYNIAGLLVAGTAGLTVLAIVLRKHAGFSALTEDHLHDLGKYLLGFSTLWAYLWFSQYMLIWYANLPEETAYFLARLDHGWSFLFYLNPILGWVLPFLVLLPRPAKRSEGHLFRVAWWMLGTRWLDIYLMVAPGTSPEHRGVGWIELGLFVGFAATFALVAARALSARPLLAESDPFLVESLHHKI